jgi:predicted PurR-regulated permease PerM
MKMMTVQGSPVVRYLTVAAAIVIVVFALKYASDFLAPILLAATLAILFTPALRWLEKKGLHTGLALLVMVLGLGGAYCPPDHHPYGLTGAACTSFTILSRITPSAYQ